MMELPEDNPWDAIFVGRRNLGAIRLGDGFIDADVVKKAILDIPRIQLMLQSGTELSAIEVMGLMALRGMGRSCGVRSEFTKE